VVITRGKYARGKYSAAIAGKIYKVLESRFDERFERALARKSPAKNAKSRGTLTVASAGKEARKPRPTTRTAPPPRIENTVITYRKDPDAAKHPPLKSGDSIKNERKPVTLIVNGKPEIVRPRVVNN
ncbi:MAG: hypothetical protein OEM82_10565, partial [Acidobacteriota bacterium]|nr:hypothetical protein [Acidobacteriota bacterium]